MKKNIEKLRRDTQASAKFVVGFSMNQEKCAPIHRQQYYTLYMGIFEALNRINVNLFRWENASTNA